jgi:hypothetical protein
MRIQAGSAEKVMEGRVWVLAELKTHFKKADPPHG